MRHVNEALVLELARRSAGAELEAMARRARELVDVFGPSVLDAVAGARERTIIGAFESVPSDGDSMPGAMAPKAPRRRRYAPGTHWTQKRGNAAKLRRAISKGAGTREAAREREAKSKSE